MASIQPCGNEAQGVAPWQTMAAEQLAPPIASGSEASAGAAESTAAQSATMQSSLARITQVSQEVNAFLGTMGGNLQDNEMLRMMIGLLILNALLGQESDSSRSSQGGAAALELLGAMSGRQEVMFYQASSSSVQVEFQQSTYATGSQSVQPSSDAAPQDSGPRLDVAA